jgi:hypothetical protein
MHLLLVIFLYFQTGVLTNEITSTLQINMPDAIVILTPLSYNLIDKTQSSTCTGTVINNYTVLTATHCRKSFNIQYINDYYGNRYVIMNYTDIPYTDISLLRSNRKFVNITPLTFAYKNTNSEAYIFGQCPYFFDTIPRIVKYYNYALVINLESQIQYIIDHWKSVDNKFMCGGDSGTAILQIQNGQFVVVGMFSMVTPDYLGNLFNENRGKDGYSFSTDFMLIE